MTNEDFGACHQIHFPVGKLDQQQQQQQQQQQ
jgi:hypothetical protein